MKKIKNIFIFLFLSFGFLFADFDFKSFVNNEFKINKEGVIIIKNKEKKFNSMIFYSGINGITEFYGKKYNKAFLSEIKKFGNDIFEERYVFLFDRDNKIPYFGIYRFLNGKEKKVIKCELAVGSKSIPNKIKNKIEIAETPYNCFDNKYISLSLNIIPKKDNNMVTFIVYDYEGKYKNITKNIFIVDDVGKIIDFKKINF